MTVQQTHPFPILAVLFGLVGTVALAVGLLGRFSPHVVEFFPMAREPLISTALVVMGLIFCVFEVLLFLTWARRRRQLE